jgi:apolipoprotein N-acyltransferase
MRADKQESDSRLFSCSTPRRAGLVAGLIHGLLLALAFPPIGWYGLIFLAPLPLVWVSWACRSKPLIAAFWVGLGMMPWWSLAHVWVASISALGFFPLAALMSGYTMLAVWASARMLRRWPALLWLWPIIWVGVEFFRGVVFLHGYPWYLLAHPLADAPLLSWPAAYLGTFTVSIMVALPATALMAWFTRRRTQACALAAAALAWPVIGLAVNPWPDASETLRVAIVQTNVPQSTKVAWTAEQRYNDWQRMRDLIVYASQLEPDLIVLPEAMMPGMTLDADSYRVEVKADLYWRRTAPDGVPEDIAATMLTEELIIFQRMLDVPILIGGAAYDNLQIVEQEQGGYRYESDARYNSVFVIDRGVPPTKRYDKVLLTPFGETMPYISASKWLETKLLGFGARGMLFDLKPGEKLEPVEVRLPNRETVRIATPVCFEATMPWVCRRLVGTDPSVVMIINLTNDGWFGSWTPGREHHLLSARWRSIETGVSMVRAANTGISSVFDERGQIIALGVLDPETGREVLDLADGVRVVDVPISDGRTPYTRIGDIVGWLSLAAAAVLLGLTFTPGQGKDRSEDHGTEPERDDRRSDEHPRETES